MTMGNCSYCVVEVSSFSGFHKGSSHAKDLLISPHMDINPPCIEGLIVNRYEVP